MPSLRRKRVATRLREYLLVTIAGVLNGISLYTFINPSNLVAGGFSGLSSTLAYVLEVILHQSLPFDTLMYIVYFSLNTPLLVTSLILLRGDFTFKTVWATLVCTLTLYLLPTFFPSMVFHESQLIAVLFGGIMIGTSMYVAAENNGSNGGTEVIARLVHKYHPEVDLSKVILIFNLVIMLVGTVVVMIIKDKRLGVVLYSSLYVWVGSSVMGVLKRGFNHPQKFIIITQKAEQIGNEISRHYKRGYSVVPMDTNDSADNRQVICVIVQYRQMPWLKRLINSYDPDAFTIIKDVHDVFSRPTFNRSYKSK